MVTFTAGVNAQIAREFAASTQYAECDRVRGTRSSYRVALILKAEVERETGLEPATSCLGSRHSTG